MKLPGFTADSSLGGSHEHYRTNCAERQLVGAIPQGQWGEGPCYDAACLSYSNCDQYYPDEVRVAQCYHGCEVPCPWGPELIPAPG
jgi:hypothetical protein